MKPNSVYDERLLSPFPRSDGEALPISDQRAYSSWLKLSFRSVKGAKIIMEDFPVQISTGAVVRSVACPTSKQRFRDRSLARSFRSFSSNEPHCEKTGLRGFRPGLIQTGL